MSFFGYDHGEEDLIQKEEDAARHAKFWLDAKENAYGICFVFVFCAGLLGIAWWVLSLAGN